MTNLKTSFLGFDFEPPLVTASGILGVTADGMIDVIRHGAGGITTKSIHLEARKGHPNPTCVGISPEIGMINAVGLSGEGIDAANATYKEYKQKEKKAPLIVSVFGGIVEHYGEIAAKADKSCADILEINISCPNVADEFGIPFAACPISARAVTEIVRKNTSKPFVIKLSPNVANIAHIAQICEDAGADGICAINTAGPGLVIDPFLRFPVLANKVGGLSGPMIKPIALKAIWDISRKVKIPVIGTGGITTGQDAIEAIMCGAAILGIGTAVYSRGIEVFGKIAEEMQEFMRAEGIKNLDEIRGCIK